MSINARKRTTTICYESCGRCDGQGKTLGTKESCSICSGTGRVFARETVVIEEDWPSDDQKGRPSLEELQRILDAPDDREVRINPDGSVTVR